MEEGDYITQEIEVVADKIDRILVVKCFLSFDHLSGVDKSMPFDVHGQYALDAID